MTALRELQKLPDSDSLKHRMVSEYPSNPLMVIVYPTKGLEREMARLFIFHVHFLHSVDNRGAWGA
ncbi:hypothetical protein ARMGADRAFT_1008167 [Armillaria gallica]|uniref:Uncharacterized protein n=1 Tax=Armillaria gallica TaxID=47427 RepID=A0A2H3DBF5_ARMGA|nr:hypothetical protein ARMGADRAFT_1014322 [Armillaria gallica]PBK99644.1 hypothetical protein ARMGADRAFT_1008167 [Armillaria gallica]